MLPTLSFMVCAGPNCPLSLVSVLVYVITVKNNLPPIKVLLPTQVAYLDSYDYRAFDRYQQSRQKGGSRPREEHYQPSLTFSREKPAEHPVIQEEEKHENYDECIEFLQEIDLDTFDELLRNC